MTRGPESVAGVITPKMTEDESLIDEGLCYGGLPNCMNVVGAYKDVEGVGCCERCDWYVDGNPDDPYWELMAQGFENSEEYAELATAGLLDDSDAYEIAYEKYQDNYESWPVMRRRMAHEERQRCKDLNWARRWPFMFVVVSCGFRPLPEQLLAGLSLVPLSELPRREYCLRVILCSDFLLRRIVSFL